MRGRTLGVDPFSIAEWEFTVMRICSGLLAALGVMALLTSSGCDVMTSPDERLTRELSVTRRLPAASKGET